MDEPELTPEQEEQLAEEIRNEHKVEKEIQPTGFVPATALESTIKELADRGLDPTNIEQFNKRMDELQIMGAERFALLKRQKETYDQIVEWLKFNRPLRYFVPNVGQEKAILPLKNIDPDEAEVIIILFAAANMVGKTTDEVALLGGCIWGRKELHPFMQQFKIFEKFEKIRARERRRLKFRIVTHSAAMEDGGLMMEEISKWWPKGLYRWEKNHKSYNSICKCWDENGRELAVIQVRTQDQPKVAHAGDTLDGTVFDEPFGKHLWAENKARIRQRMGGFILIGASPLDDFAWAQDLLADDESVHFTNAEIWDNCSNWHPNPAMWSSGKVGEGKVLTRGHVPKKVIDHHMASWNKEGPEIADARARGLFTHMSGSVFKEFDRHVHVIPNFPIPSAWPIYCVIDPHDGKPDFVTWAAQSPQGHLYFIAEHPGGRWTDCKGGSSFQGTATAIREIETPFRKQVVYRYGDPKRLESPVAATNTTTSKRKEFAKEGLLFLLADNNVQVGMGRIRSMLLCDKTNPLSKPRLYIFENNYSTGAPNQNMITAMSQLCYKKGYGDTSSDKDLGSMLQDKWKDPVDCIRYTAMSMKEYLPVDAMRRRVEAAAKNVINRAARSW